MNNTKEGQAICFSNRNSDQKNSGEIPRPSAFDNKKMIACTYFQQSFTCEMSSKEFLSENSNGSSFLEEGEEMKNLGKYIVTLFEKADNISNLSNLAF